MTLMATKMVELKWCYDRKKYQIYCEGHQPPFYPLSTETSDVPSRIILKWDKT